MYTTSTQGAAGKMGCRGKGGRRAGCFGTVPWGGGGVDEVWSVVSMLRFWTVGGWGRVSCDVEV